MPGADRHVSWRAKNDADSSAAKDERAAQQQGRLAAFATSDAFARAEKSKRLKKHRKREQQQQQQQQQQLQPRGLAKLGALGRYPTTITPALKTSWQVEALLEPARSAVDVLYAKSFLLLSPERPPPRLPVRAFRRIRRRWRRVVALVVGRARRGSRRRRRFFDGWRGWLAETVVRSVLRSAGDHTILRAAVEKLRGGYLTFAWERWTATGDRRKDWYYTHHTQPFSRLISLRTRAPTSTRKVAIEAATTELLVARTEPMTWVACHSCAGCLRKQRCTKLLDISGSRPMASHFVWRLWQLIGGGLNTCSGGLSDRRKKALAALIRPDQGIPTLKRSIARHVHFEESYTDQHWRALQSKLQGNKNATTRRPPLWTRRQMHFRRSAGRSKEGPIANRKAREEASAAQDEAFRSCLPSHAREAFEAKLEAERSRALDRRRREKRWRRWREEHAPSAILASCQDALEERVDDWRALRRQRKAIAQARREAARRRAEAAAAARLAARRQEQRLMFGEDAAAHRLRWMMQSGDDWWNSASDDERKGGDDDDDEEEENNSLFDWGVPNDKKLLNDITQLDFRARGSSPDAWKVFFERALPLYVKLKVLDLSDNGELNIDIAELVGRLPPTLKELRLNGTQCFGDGRSAAHG